MGILFLIFESGQSIKSCRDGISECSIYAQSALEIGLGWSIAKLGSCTVSTVSGS